MAQNLAWKQEPQVFREHWSRDASKVYFVDKHFSLMTVAEEDYNRDWRLLRGNPCLSSRHNSPKSIKDKNPMYIPYTQRQLPTFYSKDKGKHKQLWIVKTRHYQ